ncbi:redoxin domain-containing protein [Patescibacteria group bacterium]
MIQINQEIPDVEFEVFHKNAFKKMKVSSLKGKWLIMLFYPADFTFVCPTELSEAADYYSKFTKEGAEIISVSTDTVFVHKAWYDESPSIGKIKYPMAADPTGKLSRAFGTYIEDEGLSLRATFIIDPKQKLKSMDIHDNSIGRNIVEIFRKFQAAKYVNEHAGQACPASWTPKAKTLKPGIDLVGKI